MREFASPEDTGAPPRGPRCRACASASVVTLVDAGLHPVANRFLRDPSDREDRFHLVVVQCRACGLIQLRDPVPVAALAPQFEWITYNEPEGHLDAVARLISDLPGVSRGSLAGGITYKDDSTLARLRSAGIDTAWRLDPVTDLESAPTAGLETIQQRVTPDRADVLARTRRPVDVLLVRHILEHAFEPRRFAEALRMLVRPGGYVVFEVPDCTQVLDALDYTMIWEEHLAYYTPATFRDSLARLGFDVVAAQCYPYPCENSLVTAARATGGESRCVPDLEAELQRGARFSARFGGRKAAIQSFLAARRAAGQRTALFGAGHLSCMFINLMDVASEIAFVVDDHPGKRGLLMPGSHVLIKGSEALLSERIDLCLSTLSPESEEKVVARQAAFLERGGTFASVFPSSRRALALPASVERSA